MIPSLRKTTTLQKIPYRTLHVATVSRSNNVVVDEVKAEKSFKEKVRKTWNGPTFKYWFIGGTGFISWLGYYSYKAYKNKCIDIDLPPSLTNHYVFERDNELNQLLNKYKEQSAMFYEKNNVRKLMVSGPSASGKTTLVSQFITQLKENQLSAVKLPASSVSFFLQTDSEASFLISLKAAAAKLEVHTSDLDECVPDNAFNKATFQEQCDSLIINIQDKLEKHPGWVIVFDQLQSTTPKSLIDIMNSCLNDEDNWSSGLFIVAMDGVDPKSIAVNGKSIVSLHKGLEIFSFRVCFDNSF